MGESSDGRKGPPAGVWKGKADQVAVDVTVEFPERVREDGQPQPDILLPRIRQDETGIHEWFCAVATLEVFLDVVQKHRLGWHPRSIDCPPSLCRLQQHGVACGPSSCGCPGRRGGASYSCISSSVMGPIPYHPWMGLPLACTP